MLINLDEEKLISRVGLPFGIAYIVFSALEAIKNPPALPATSRPSARARPQPTSGPKQPRAKPTPTPDASNNSGNAKRLIFALEKEEKPALSKSEEMAKLGQTASDLRSTHGVMDYPAPPKPQPEQNKLRNKKFLWSSKSKPEKGSSSDKNTAPKSLSAKPDKTLRPTKKSGSSGTTKAPKETREGKAGSLEAPPSPRKEPDLPVSPRGEKKSKDKAAAVPKAQSSDKIKKKDSKPAKVKSEKKVKKKDENWAMVGQPNWLTPDSSWGRPQAADIPDALIEKLAGQADSELTVPHIDIGESSSQSATSDDKRVIQDSSSDSSSSEEATITPRGTTVEPKAAPAMKNSTLANLIKQQKERQGQEKPEQDSSESHESSSSHDPAPAPEPEIKTRKPKERESSKDRDRNMKKQKSTERVHHPKKKSSTSKPNRLSSPPPDSLPPPAEVPVKASPPEPKPTPPAPKVEVAPAPTPAKAQVDFIKVLRKFDLTKLIQRNQDLLESGHISNDDFADNKETIANCFMNGSSLSTTMLKGFEGGLF